MRTPHLAIHEQGAGAPIVLLHSSGFSSRQWRRLATELAAAGARAIVPDLLGYGASTPWPDGAPFELREDVDAIVRLLDELAAPAHLVGHSYGGLLALQAALHRPAAVRSLALYEPVAFGVLDTPDDTPIRDAVIASVDAPFDGEPWLRRFVEWWNGPGGWDAMAPEAKASFLAVGWKLACEVKSLVADRTSRAAYATIAAPTLLLGGDLTPVPEQLVVARLAAALPAARHQRIAGAGHMGPITHGAAVNAAIAAHLAAVSAPA
jgi:pimeloyl-ACP methyl ester carboxylesterase